jgi:3-oxoacyl-[acyl-carrier protein] reductase
MDLGLQGRNALVAAGTSGLGLAVARELAREGARVFICGRDTDRLARALADLRADPRIGGADRVDGIAADLESDDGPRRFVESARARFGSAGIVVANCGGPPPGSVRSLDRAAWESAFRRSFLSSQQVVELGIDGMRASRWGRIVFITSVSVKQPLDGLAASSAIRSAVSGYSKCLSDEFARDGITVNCVAPGTTTTPRVDAIFAARAAASGRPIDELTRAAEAAIPARRFGRAEEFAAVVAFLASERASYITGVVIPVDGGATRSLV